MDIIRLKRRDGRTTYMIERSSRTGELVVWLSSLAKFKELQILSFDQLMSRFFDALNLKHPRRPLDEEVRNHLAFSWIGKEAELREKIMLLELECQQQ